MTELGTRLRNMREARHLTQEQLAKLAAIPYDTYRKYEMGSVRPRTEHLERLAKVHDLSTDEILGIGTVYTLEYDKELVNTLRRALATTCVDEIKAEKIQEALDPLIEQEREAIQPPEMTKEQMDYYATPEGTSIRTVRFDPKVYNLIREAEREVFCLRESRYVTALKGAFSASLLRITEESEKLPGRPEGFRHQRTRNEIKKGRAVEVAKAMVRNRSSGFDDLVAEGRIDLTTEYLIVHGGFDVLFPADVVEVAKERCLAFDTLV